MKLKTNNFFTRDLRIKIRNQKNKDQSWNTNNREDEAIIFSDKPLHYHW
jgi:TnpA family transposase